MLKLPIPGSAVRALVVLAFVAAATLWWLLGSRPTVEVTTVVTGDAAQVVYATGVVEPVTWSKVASLQRKRIIDICRCEGQAVKKGDVLARLDDVEETAALAELTARRDRLQEDVNRLRGLLERNVGSRVAYDERVTQLREYEARISAQRDRIYDLELRAPMDGIVLRRDGEIGEIAGIGNNDVLLWVGQPKPLRIVADVNEEDIVRVRPGQKALVRHESQAAEPLAASVDSVTPKGDPASRTFRVYLALPDDTPLRIGMSVEANIVVREASGVLLLPAEAIAAGRVMVLDGERVRSVTVRTGIVGSRMVEVVEGLREGQRVVSPARSGLKEGTRVRVVEARRPDTRS
jgi:membrane fusion protein (multidrug efflux system)